MEKKVEPSQIKTILKENLTNQNVIFVFPTDIDCSSWIDWAVKNPEESGVKTVELRRFFPWDKFKEEFLCAKKSGYHAIPSILRKFFVHQVLLQNAKANKNNQPDIIFSTIINSQFADNALFFTDWLAKNLSALDMWHNRFTQRYGQNFQNADGEDKDYKKLYDLYCAFLEKHKMFEQAWEKPDFSESNFTFILFFPEILEDFLEYEVILKKLPNIQICRIPELKNIKIKGTFYENSRTEIRKTALKIRELADSGIEWNDIAVHIPDLESIRPYIEREFREYCIPFVCRAGVPFTKNCAGKVFELLNECKKSDFSYNSIRQLLLNGYIPWKKADENGFQSDWVQELIRAGCELHCLCSYKKDEISEKTTDVWEETLKAGGNKTYSHLEKYKALKKSILAITDANSFEKIEKNWFSFKETFLDEENFTQEADNILSRCIKYLEELISIEKSYFEQMDFKISNPFDFFVNELKNKTYTPQAKKSGVNIFKYKVAPCAAFKYNFVIDCSQNNMAISYKQLDFLNDIKRKELGIGSVDVSKSFLWLYNKFHNESQQFFSCSENTFSGFAIPHNFIETNEKSDKEESSFYQDKNDFVRNEKEWFSREDSSTDFLETPQVFSKRQISQFNSWKEKIYSSKESSASYSVCQNLAQKVHKNLYSDARKINEKIPGSAEDIIKITQTDLSSFFNCPRKWLFSKILKLKEDSLETNLMDIYEMGNLYHLIIQKFLEKIKDKKINLICTQDENNPHQKDAKNFGNSEQDVISFLSKSFDEAVKERAYFKTPLVLEMLKSQKSKITDTIYNLMIKIFSNQNFSGATPSFLEKEFWAYIKEMNVCLYGKIDCILSSDDGESGFNSILDFKKTSVKSANQCWLNQKLTKDGENIYTLEDFQIPLYMKLTEKNGIPSEYAYFASVQSDELKKIVPKTKNEGREEYEDTINFAIELASEFRDSIENMNFQPIANSKQSGYLFEPTKTCLKCNFQSVCRTMFSVAGNPVSRAEE